MKKVFLICTLIAFSLTAFTQQSLVDTKRLIVRDSIKFDGAWRKAWPGGLYGTWNLRGNTSTNPATDFIGTTGAQDWVIKTNAVERGRFSSGSASGQLFKVSGTGITTGVVNWVNGSAVTTGIGLYVDANSITGNGRVAEFSTTSLGNFISGAFRVIAQEAHTGSLVDFYTATQTGTIHKITGWGLTTGTGLEIKNESNSLNSTNGLFYVNNSVSSTSGIIARLKANSTSGSGYTLNANGKSGFGTITPDSTVHIAGSFKLVNGTQGADKVLTSDASGGASWQTPSVTSMPDKQIPFGTGTGMASSDKLQFDSTTPNPKFTVTSASNDARVGINVDNPAVALDVAGDVGVNGSINVNSNSGNNSIYATGFIALGDASNETFIVIAGSDQDDEIQYQSNNGHKFNTGIVTITNLSGTGTRAVVADASGVLSAPDINPARPYKVYTALLSQFGTDAPVAIVLENTIGTIVWTRFNEGEYRGTLIGAFTNCWTIINVNNVNNNGDFAYAKIMRQSINVVVIVTVTDGVVTDGMLESTEIEIRVYN